MPEEPLVGGDADARALDLPPPGLHGRILREVDAVRDRAQVTILAFLDQSTPEPK